MWSRCIMAVLTGVEDTSMHLRREVIGFHGEDVAVNFWELYLKTFCFQKHLYFVKQHLKIVQALAKEMQLESDRKVRA